MLVVHVDQLRNRPLHALVHRGLLLNGAARDDEAFAEFGLLRAVVGLEIDALGAVDKSAVAGRDQIRALVEQAMAILAPDRDWVAHLAVELAVAVCIAFEVAIRTLHSFLAMDVDQLDRAIPLAVG